jgi:hypothetical protein
MRIKPTGLSGLPCIDQETGASLPGWRRVLQFLLICLRFATQIHLEVRHA